MLSQDCLDVIEAVLASGLAISLRPRPNERLMKSIADERVLLDKDQGYAWNPAVRRAWLGGYLARAFAQNQIVQDARRFAEGPASIAPTPDCETALSHLKAVLALLA